MDIDLTKSKIVHYDESVNQALQMIEKNTIYYEIEEATYVMTENMIKRYNKGNNCWKLMNPYLTELFH
jgi:predicted S18 family serine protease